MYSRCDFLYLHICPDGILLLEVNRMLRAGGYFAWAAQPVYKHELALEEQWEGMLRAAKVRNVFSYISFC